MNLAKSQHKWDEPQDEIRALRKEYRQILKAVQSFTRKYNSTIGALETC